VLAVALVQVAQVAMVWMETAFRTTVLVAKAVTDN
jgi:hypothetical protein